MQIYVRFHSTQTSSLILHVRVLTIALSLLSGKNATMVTSHVNRLPVFRAN